MEIIVKKLGPIESATIDLSKNLIVFSGQNNTGKTFLTTLIYSIYNERFRFSSTELPNIDRTIIENRMLIEVNICDFFEINKDLIKQQLASTIIKNIPKYFSIDSGKFSDFEIDFTFKKHFKNLVRNFSFSEIREFENSDGIKIDIDIRKILNSSIVTFEIEDSDDNLDFFPEYIKGVLSEMSKNILFQKSFFVPAERQGMNLFSKELSALKKKNFELLIDLDTNRSIELISFIKERTNRYSQGINDALNFIEDINLSTSLKESFLHSDVKNFEKNVLGGTTSISEEGNLMLLSEDLALDMNSMSSTVKSLALFTYYLKHVVTKKDFIIIDEPELNLHPDNQIKVIQFISYLVNNGIKILISTHSEYMIRELNNLIIAKTALEINPTEASRFIEKYNYPNDYLLSYREVCVYLFRKKERVENIKVGRSGFEVKTIDSASELINKISNDFYFNFFE